MFKSNALFNVFLVLFFLSSQGLDAKKGKGGGAREGELEEGEVDANFYTSPGSQGLPILTDLVEAKAEFEALRTRGPSEGTASSPYQSEPVEEGENYVETVTNSSRRMLNVFLPDHRVDVDVTQYPYRTVGRFGGCTATLVYNSGIIVTNAHCLKYKADGTFDPSTFDVGFYAGYKNGNYMATSKPKAIWYNKNQDYAVMKLWSNIDSLVGRMGIHWRELSYFKLMRPLQMIGYNSDHCMTNADCRPKLSMGVSRGVLGSNVLHDLDSKRGSSGSAMFGYFNGFPVMQALNFGEDRDGGEVSLTLPLYDGSHPNAAKPAAVIKYGYNKVKDF